MLNINAMCVVTEVLNMHVSIKNVKIACMYNVGKSVNVYSGFPGGSGH